MSSRYPAAFQLLFFSLASVGIGQSMLFAILPPAARQLGISPFQVSAIFATSASIWVFVSPWWGRRSDVTGRRNIILFGLLGFALSMASLAGVIQIGLAGLLAPAIVYPLMIAARSLFALLGSGTGPASQAYIADRTSRDDRAAAIALVSGGMGLGQTIGPGIGAALASYGLLTPLYLSAALAVLSAATIGLYLPESERSHSHDQAAAPRLSFRDRRVWPFVAVQTSLQAVRATTVISFGFFLQDALKLGSAQTVRYTGIGFVVLAVFGLFSQLVLVQRLQPTARTMIRAGTGAMAVAFALFITRASFPLYLVGLALLGAGIGLVRPGCAAAASLAVEADEQGSVAGVLNGVSVIGNVVGPLLGTRLYSIAPIAPFVLNGAVMAGIFAFVLASRRLGRRS